MNENFIGENAPVYLISVAAQLADMHPQTLRQYDRLGLVVPRRQGGRHRRYSARDVARLRQIQTLSQDGVSLEGIRRILELEAEVQALQDRVSGLQNRVRQLNIAARASLRPTEEGTDARVFVADGTGGVTTFGAGRASMFVRPLPLPAARTRRILAIGRD
ncbi:heat shock protein transcriptional repressor HspR [Micrococcoides hystricis]|uniref:Heat shock protein transcriptional repressor HspR n=1 Tax=Micrococcoides hystricis TaxID=1572761 RepID=A0ABV6PDQ3_9MICC